MGDFQGHPFRGNQWTKVGDAASFGYHEKDDDAYYHVTTEAKAERILSEGLRPHAGRETLGGWWGNYSRGKVFLAERRGVAFWRNRIEEALQHQTDDEPPKLVVVRIPKAAVPEGALKVDEPGTKDSRSGSYYSETEIGSARAKYGYGRTRDVTPTRAKRS